MNEPFVPFTAETSLLQGARVLVTEYSGVLRMEESELVLEFTSRRTSVGGGGGVFVVTTGESVGTLMSDQEDNDVKTVRIPLAQIGSLELRGGFLLPPRLNIEVNRMGVLAAVPWAKGSRCTLKLARRDLHRVRELTVDVRLRAADAQLRRLGESDLSDS